MAGLAIQERFAPENRCFGCGPANTRGLRIRSFPAAGAERGGRAEAGADERRDELVCDWTPEAHHEAFGNVLNGGIIGTLLDCHSNWAASWHLMRRDGLDDPPVTVTMDFHVKLRRPTPTDAPVHLRAWTVESDGPKVEVAAELTAGGKVTATCVGHFLAVGPDHPAYRQR